MVAFKKEFWPVYIGWLCLLLAMASGWFIKRAYAETPSGAVIISPAEAGSKRMVFKNNGKMIAYVDLTQQRLRLVLHSGEEVDVLAAIDEIDRQRAELKGYRKTPASWSTKKKQ